MGGTSFFPIKRARNAWLNRHSPEIASTKSIRLNHQTTFLLSDFQTFMFRQIEFPDVFLTSLWSYRGEVKWQLSGPVKRLSERLPDAMMSWTCSMNVIVWKQTYKPEWLSRRTNEMKEKNQSDGITITIEFSLFVLENLIVP